MPATADDPSARGGLRLRTVVLMAVMCLAVLGQGERFDVDPRFRSPSATLFTYWRALQRHDTQTLSECFVDPRDAMPFPGSIWFLPQGDQVELQSMQIVGASGGHLVAVYEVRFRPAGAPDAKSFVTSTELLRRRGEWLIVPQAEGEDPLPNWDPGPRSVDI